MGGCRCSFRDCTVATSQHPGMHFFHFPVNDRERYIRWLSLANVIHMLEMPPGFQNNKVICARHFRPECFKNYRRNGILPKNVEPTLMPINEEMVLDYANEEENGGPELIKMPTPTMKHLIPPPGYTLPFSLHDNLKPGKYIRQNKIILANAATQSKDIKRGNETQLDTKDPSNSKKAKILNCETIGVSSNSSESRPADTIVKLNFDFDSDEISLKEDVDVASDDYEFIDEGTIEITNNSLLPNQQCEDSTEELQEKDSQFEIDPEELTDCINHLKEQLERSNKESKSKTNALQKTEADLDKANIKLETVMQKYEKLSAQFKQLNEQLEETKVQVNSKIITFNGTEEELKTANFKLKNIEQKYEQLDVNYKKVLKREQDLTEENLRLQEENFQLREKCKQYEKENKQKHIGEVSTSQAGSSAAMDCGNVNRRQPGATGTSMQNSLTKAQLFNGVKKYMSSSMVALLRMEMFGSADRDWKPDERRVAMDLLQLGDQIYRYISDEWRFRLPALEEVRNWLADATNSIDDEEDL
ncbi:uncharacterized protein LOC118746938 [Rhagoletis pomonella]|uniref:uncharacterized protein LOC118746938 n=1 Tax=Rhagoletis pomonella TaxID=28610 RepID=UPI001783C754|nr:uncharacterized protein LOC118746938 [Rhagoletis pomonella]XP_036336823.1 uncharacterized protein LOC118746938 [Rhagoletis pomonella]